MRSSGGPTEHAPLRATARPYGTLAIMIMIMIKVLVKAQPVYRICTQKYN